ncbi:hypothetical protein L602_001500000840 [Cupriavidus gilardii J11]|uniref:AbiTii domain-containing protein n=1 Tax=Cupriavidus gilardii J11 TaxID=936133 RepID=A0A562BRY5_9BURK|nr:hypothetical protein [Cupriavidus gilardii]TWG87951.1 hypothetical protein L602_001500000840 [Cupriavidus gilardii J11]
MTLIQDIQAAAIGPSTDVSRLLRMCKLLAARLGHAQFAQWVDYELNGYPKDVELPDYRRANVLSFGHFVGAFGRQCTLQIPLSVLPSDLRELFSAARLNAPVSAYQRLAAAEPGQNPREEWPSEFAVRYGSKAAVDMQCIKAWKLLPAGLIDSLLDAIKTRVLGFAIDIEKEDPEAGESPIGAQPISEPRMTQIFNTNITGHVGNISNGSIGFSQHAQVNAEAGDWDALRRSLQSLGLKDADLAGLQADLDEARQTASGMEGKPLRWLGTLIGKAATGASGIAVEVAAAGIAKAIAAYLGLS